MWWILQITAIVCVSIALIFARWYGFAYTGKVGFLLGSSLFVPWAVKVGIEFIAAFAFIKSYAIAPSFFQPWFLGAAALALVGFLGSLIFFGEVVGTLKILGAILALVGSVLLIL